MSLFSFKSNKKVISLVFNDYSVRMVENHNQTFNGVKRWDEKPLPPDVIMNGKIVDEARLLDFMKQCIFEWGIRKWPIQFFVPNSTVIMRNVQVPADIADEEVNGYFMMELGTTLHLPFQNPVLDVHLFPKEEDEKMRQGILFATPENEIEKYREIFEEAKLEPIAADVPALSLYRYFYESDLAAREENYLFVEFDLTSVNISIFSNHSPEFLRFQTLNLDHADWSYSFTTEGELKWTFKNDIEVMWAQIHDQHLEIERILNFYKFSMNQGSKEISQVVITGDHPYLNNIHERLQGIVDIPVTILPGQADLQMGRQFIPALGLSVKEVR